MHVFILIALLALFVQNYALNNNNSSFNMNLYADFKAFYPAEITAEYSTLEIFIEKLLDKEDDFERINKQVTEYAKNKGYCSNKSSDAIPYTLMVVTDMQKAFMSNGPVAVNGAEDAIYYINEAEKHFGKTCHSVDSHDLWSRSFSLNPNYVDTFYPHSRLPKSKKLVDDSFNEVDGLNTCADAYFGKVEFAITSNPSFKKYLLKNDITKVTFTGVAGDYCVNAGILGVLDDPELSHIQVSLYEPGVKWVFPDSIISQKSNLERYSNFRWIYNIEGLLSFLNLEI